MANVIEEQCGYCLTEVVIPINETSLCPVCAKLIKPCTYCHTKTTDCSKCKYSNEIKIKPTQKIVAQYYRWGDFQEEDYLEVKDISTTTFRSIDAYACGFNFQGEHEELVFIADESDIDSDEHGTGVKIAYAISHEWYEKLFNPSKEK